MNQATATATLQSTRPAARGQAGLARRQRVGSAIASVLVTGVLFCSVVLGMTSAGDDARAVVAQARSSVRA